MALPPLDIRYSKYAFYPFIGMSIGMIGTMTWLVFFTIPAPLSTLLWITYFINLAVNIFIIRWLWKRSRRNEPVLTFSPEGLTVHRRKQRYIPWSSITGWKIVFSKSTHVLIIRHQSGKVRISLGMLELSPGNIRELIQSYIRQPGPGGFKR